MYINKKKSCTKKKKREREITMLYPIFTLKQAEQKHDNKENKIHKPGTHTHINTYLKTF